MSERERWIVYPLLFLALGAALRDKLIKQTNSDRIVCRELWVQEGERITRVLKGNTLSIENIQADRMLQGGQPVVTFNPQFLRALNLLGGGSVQPAPSRQAPEP